MGGASSGVQAQSDGEISSVFLPTVDLIDQLNKTTESSSLYSEYLTNYATLLDRQETSTQSQRWTSYVDSLA